MAKAIWQRNRRCVPHSITKIFIKRQSAQGAKKEVSARRKAVALNPSWKFLPGFLLLLLLFVGCAFGPEAAVRTVTLDGTGEIVRTDESRTFSVSNRLVLQNDKPPQIIELPLELPDGWGARIYATHWVMRVQQISPTIGQSNAILTVCEDATVKNGSPSGLFSPDNGPTALALDVAHWGTRTGERDGIGILVNTEYHNFSGFPLEVGQSSLYLAAFSDADSPSVAGVKIWYRKVKLSPEQQKEWAGYWTDGC